MDITLEQASNWATILTAIVAVAASLYYYLGRRSKRVRLEAYLKKEKIQNPDKHTHTVLHLMSELGMTEEEVFRASFDSSRIARRIRPNPDTNLAQDILFEFKKD